jgi:hypothetical protein
LELAKAGGGWGGFMCAASFCCGQHALVCSLVDLPFCPPGFEAYVLKQGHTHAEEPHQGNQENVGKSLEHGLICEYTKFS